MRLLTLSFLLSVVCCATYDRSYSGSDPKGDASDARSSPTLQALLEHSLASLKTSSYIIALDPNLSRQARLTISSSGRETMAAKPWTDNNGRPPRGILLIEELNIEGNIGSIRFVLGSTSGPFSCGAHGNWEFTWNGGEWDSRALVLGVC
jgi:hypothetical protein